MGQGQRMKDQPIIIATRGSALALAQTNLVLARCREKIPTLEFQVKIIKTTGDKLQTASLSRPAPATPKGLFTKELEAALLKGRADLAVHSLKDLPTELPEGLKLGAVAGQREDPRDVLIYKEAPPFPRALADFPRGLTVATSSTRRKAQLLALRPDFNIIDIRGNVATRLRKVAGQADIGATVLAAAGLARLKWDIGAAGCLTGEGVPAGLLALVLETEQMLPCPGQAAIGLEIRVDDSRLAAVCRELNDEAAFQCVTAERAFLRAMGGGCQSPVGACATLSGTQLRLRAVSFLGGGVRHAEAQGPAGDPEGLGRRVAEQLK
jgi:hydroxymethylbilane synthase